MVVLVSYENTKKLKQLLILCICVFWKTSTVWAGEIILIGKYHGKDIYVQNPYDDKKNSYCTSAVFVNDRQVQDYPTALAFTVDLSHLSIGDLVVLRIEHSNDCAPKVVNPQVLKEKEGFEFLLEQVDNNSVSWNTKGELPGGKFVLEQLDSIGNNWSKIKEIGGKGIGENNQYSISPDHYEGINQYRVKYIGHDSKESYSLKLTYTYTTDPVLFTPKTKVTNKITLSREAPYTISDMNGNKVKEGTDKVIMVQDLKRGLYYLNIQNRSERFIKQ